MLFIKMEKGLTIYTCTALLLLTQSLFSLGQFEFTEDRTPDCPKPVTAMDTSSRSDSDSLDFSACIFPIPSDTLPKRSSSPVAPKRSYLNVHKPRRETSGHPDMIGHSGPNSTIPPTETMPSLDEVFGSKQHRYRYILPVNWTSPTTGLVSSGDCVRMIVTSCPKVATFQLIVPEGHVVMISFPWFIMKWPYYSFLDGYVELLALHKNSTKTRIWKITKQRSLLPEVYHTSLELFLYVPENDRLIEGFLMSFAILPAEKAPRKVGKGLFDCAVNHFPLFKHILGCNLKAECEGGEDEGAFCSFSNKACKGEVTVGGKCYIHVRRDRQVSWQSARNDCQQRGGDLATVKSDDEWMAFFKVLFLKNLQSKVFIGLHSSHSPHPHIYHNMYVWVDGVVNYATVTRSLHEHLFFDRICFAYSGGNHLAKIVFYVHCDRSLYQDYVCQIPVENVTSNSSAVFPIVPVLENDPDNTTRDRSSRLTLAFTSSLVSKFSPAFTTLWQNHSFLVVCPVGHVTHDFLAHDPRSQCVEKDYVSHHRILSNGQKGLLSNDVIPMFVCADLKSTLPYSLVCDFRKDCLDDSDEAFCVHPGRCSDAVCKSGQCVRRDRTCDGTKDCWDSSDEECGVMSLFRNGRTIYTAPPADIYFGADRKVTIEPKHPKHKDECPRTHFLCPEGYCLPVYCRCNGLADCRGKEDEAGCEAFHCPGFYRCLSSRECLHARHVCDGNPQCPQRDDEWLCNATCPQGCDCEGHSFICSRTFPSSEFPHVRYLDATGSRTEPGDVSGLQYLVWLNLAWCELTDITRMVLPNMRYLNLSHNQLVFINMDSFLTLQNMIALDLSSNPLLTLFSQSSNLSQTALSEMVLSNVTMRSFNCVVLSNFPKVRKLNLSYSPSLTEISAEGLRPLSWLESLDLRGSNLQDYPADVFLNLTMLREIHADNYKLCCTDLLPENFHEENCHARKDEISSCDDLLRSNSYRAFLWMFSILSIVGNMGCLITRQYLVKNKSMTSFNMFVTNLSVADLLMGVYLALVGAADQAYRGEYFWYEKTWKPSVACHIAGFLSLLSSETSAFIICLITLDRFLVLSSPFSDVRFKRRTTIAACSLSWTFGLMLAAIPLLPMASEWQFYSHTGICIPLPITRSSFKGRNYAFGIMIIFNLVLFLLIAVGQGMIYWTIRTASMAQSSTRKTKDLTIARRLLSIVLTDFMCWFPIGMLGVMATAGMPIPGEVNVGMAIFVLPLNAALNPFLYTFNAVMERVKLREEERLLKQIEARIQDLQNH